MLEYAMKKERYDITGMSCAACSARVEKTVGSLSGIDNVAVNLLTNSMQVSYDETVLSQQDIVRAVEGAGYGATVQGAVKVSSVEEQTRDEMTVKRRSLCWSIALLIPELYISMHQMIYSHLGIEASDLVKSLFDGPENAMTFAFTQLLLVLPIVALNKGYYINGFRNLVHRSPNMDSLVGLGSAAALVYGIVNTYFIGWHLGHGNFDLVPQYSSNLYFESAAMIVTLVSVGKYLESKAKHSTTSALRRLMDYAPKTVTVDRNGIEKEIPADQLVTGDVVIARPGALIAADGVIVEGRTTIDESVITGESIPADKTVGDEIVSGSININGHIKYTAQQVGAASTLNRLIALVEEAANSKAPMARLADRIAGVFVPVVILIAAITGAVWLGMGYGTEMAFSMAVSVLVISCPCALGLATPVAIMAGIGKGAENGILIKSGEILERVSHVSTVVLDKTGTITEGRPSVTDWIPLGISREELMQRAALLEQGSEHPIGRAVVEAATPAGGANHEVTDFQAVWGQGVMGKIQGKFHYLGNAGFVGTKINIEEKFKIQGIRIAGEGKTALYMADEAGLIGIIGVADQVKKTSRVAMDRFKALGLKVIMLTGDGGITARAVARELGIEQYVAEVRPEEKAGYIQDLQSMGKKVAMIGDGVNDAPALALADAGIAIGAGTDIALESADAILSRNNLMDAAGLIWLSRATIKNIKENLFWAFFYNIICIPVAAGVLYPTFGIKLSPMMGAAAMSFSSVCVVLNALRLKRVELHHEDTDSEGNNTEQKGVTEPMEQNLKINGMMCMHCQKNVERVLGAIDGVESVQVSLEAGTALVKCQKEIPMETFGKVIADAGYELVQ